MDPCMNDKQSEVTDRIYDAINSLWGSRIIGGLFVLVVVWAIVDNIIGGAR